MIRFPLPFGRFAVIMNLEEAAVVSTGLDKMRVAQLREAYCRDHDHDHRIMFQSEDFGRLVAGEETTRESACGQFTFALADIGYDRMLGMIGVAAAGRADG